MSVVVAVPFIRIDRRLRAQPQGGRAFYAGWITPGLPRHVRDPPKAAKHYIPVSTFSGLYNNERCVGDHLERIQ